MHKGFEQRTLCCFYGLVRLSKEFFHTHKGFEQPALCCLWLQGLAVQEIERLKAGPFPGLEKGEVRKRKA